VGAGLLAENYEGAPEDSSKPWREESSRDCNLRMLRGGSWGHLPRLVRSAYRGALEPDSRHYFLGFRLARDLY
jgi:formylglycine-generating enzyme required for sulfatase activity